MKIALLKIIIISLNLNNKQEIIGITSNAPTLGFNDLEAVTYGSAQIKKENDPSFLLNNMKDVKDANIVDKLPKQRVNPVLGNNEPFQNAHEIGQDRKDYPQQQDGTDNLLKSQNVCRLFVKQTCLRKDYCGWCGGDNACVQGSQGIQSQACSNQYIYTN